MEAGERPGVGMMNGVNLPAGRRVRIGLLAGLVFGVLVGSSSASPLGSFLLRRQSLSTGLVAYWPLDTIAAGTTPDTSGTTPANTATLFGGPTTAAGKIGN